eukprot:403374250
MDEIDLIIYKIKEYYLNVIKKQNDLIEVQVDQINELKSQICKNQQTESELSTVNLKLNKELMDIKSQIPCEGSNSNQTQTNLFIENPKTYQLVEFAVVDQVQQQKLNKKFQILNNSSQINQSVRKPFQADSFNENVLDVNPFEKNSNNLSQPNDSLKQFDNLRNRYEQLKELSQKGPKKADQILQLPKKFEDFDQSHQSENNQIQGATPLLNGSSNKLLMLKELILRDKSGSIISQTQQQLMKQPKRALHGNCEGLDLQQCNNQMKDYMKDVQSIIVTKRKSSIGVMRRSSQKSQVQLTTMNMTYLDRRIFKQRATRLSPIKEASIFEEEEDSQNQVEACLDSANSSEKKNQFENSGFGGNNEDHN